MQVWTQPNDDQFIMTPFDNCLRLTPYSGATERTFHVADCWLNCLRVGFRLVTYFLVDTPDAKLNASLVDALHLKETHPWETRYCVDMRKIMKNKDKNQA